jgi:uncharacterized protein (TIGR02246 family)
MNNKLWVPGSIALALLLAGCEQAGPNRETGAATDTAAAAEAVNRTEQEMLAAFQAKDATKLASYYASDAVLATPGRPASKGSEAVSKTLGEDLADPNFKLDFTNEKTEVAASGDIAYTHGSFNVTFTNPQTKQPESGSGTYVSVFKKQADGSWKAVADVATSAGQ